MIMRDAVVEGSGNFDHLVFFNVHPNLSTQAYNISASIGNAAATAGIRSRDLRVEATTVQDCFKHAGFSVCAGDADDASDTIDQTLDIVDEACKALLAEVLEREGVTEGISFPDFRDADSDVQTSPDMSDEATVASVVEMSPNDSDEDDMESDNTGDPCPTVAEATHCVSVMQVFAKRGGWRKSWLTA
ncbi:hypothetical protein HPB51_021571 [Rhipicephalus microplus]|uniref:Uncharacterized protein n=1 Tax=Rhipicephalus microplus TaxID=6941 RepID=A0A9J6DC52_RHIMP|nr:hypothetical protein HPB51_021571 [Rhipicephalus microplus]